MARLKRSGAQVLESTQTTSHEFYIRRRRGHESFFQVDLRNHALDNVPWTLQMRAPNGEWQDFADSSKTWYADERINFTAVHDRPFRLHGGTAGAEAWYYYP